MLLGPYPTSFSALVEALVASQGTVTFIRLLLSQPTRPRGTFSELIQGHIIPYPDRVNVRCPEVPHPPRSPGTWRVFIPGWAEGKVQDPEPCCTELESLLSHVLSGDTA